jgi:membrane protein YdbS with pleckstrin-like domain
MWHGIDPRIRTVWTVGALIVPAVLTIAAAGMIVVDIPIVPWILATVAVVLIVLGIFVPSARWRSWGYRLTETELMIRFGVLIKVQRWLPRTRIQHVDIVGGPIERALGLRQIVIYTAGTREADVTIPGLQTMVAEQLRADLLSWVETTGPTVERTEPSGIDESSPSGPAEDAQVDEPGGVEPGHDVGISWDEPAGQ